MRYVDAYRYAEGYLIRLREIEATTVAVRRSSNSAPVVYGTHHHVEDPPHGLHDREQQRQMVHRR